LAINLGSFNIEVFLIHMQLTTNKNEQNRHNGKGFEWCTFTVFLVLNCIHPHMSICL
jgi:uracil DNA glycosylase